jgi:hypothetical protein
MKLMRSRIFMINGAAGPAEMSIGLSADRAAKAAT